MKLTWAEFYNAVADPRFLLPLHEFFFDLSFVEVRPNPDERTRLANIITTTVVDTLRLFPESDLGALRGDLNTGALSVATEDADVVYFNLSYGSPVFGFGVAVSSRHLQIFKPSTTLEHLIITLPRLETLARNLFLRDGQNKLPYPTFTEAAEIENSIVRVEFAFSYKISLTSHINKSLGEPSNVELHKRLVNVGLPLYQSIQDHQHPLDNLTPEQLLRADLTFSFLKTLANRPRELWINYEGPWNFTQKDVNLKFSYRTGGSKSPLEAQDLYDWETPVQRFFLDLVMNRFMPDLFYDINVAARLR